MCILNTNQPTHVAHPGSQSLIDLSVSSLDFFRLPDTYVYPDLFDSDYCRIIHKMNYATVNYTFNNWEVVETCLNRDLENHDHTSTELLYKQFHDAVASNSFKYIAQRSTLVRLELCVAYQPKTEISASC